MRVAAHPPRAGARGSVRANGGSGRDGGRKQRQRPGTASAAVLSRPADPSEEPESGLRIEQAPRHGANLVKDVKRTIGHFSVDPSGRSEEPQVAVDFLGRRVGNPPEVHPVSSGPAMPLSQVGRYRTSRPDDLIGDRFQRGGNPHREPDRDASAASATRTVRAIGRSGVFRDGCFELTAIMIQSSIRSGCLGLLSYASLSIRCVPAYSTLPNADSRENIPISRSP